MVPGLGQKVVSMTSPVLKNRSPYCQTSLSEPLEKGGSNLNRSFGAGLVSRLIRYFGTSRFQFSGGKLGIGLRSSVAVVVGISRSLGLRVRERLQFDSPAANHYRVGLVGNRGFDLAGH